MDDKIPINELSKEELLESLLIYGRKQLYDEISRSLDPIFEKIKNKKYRDGDTWYEYHQSVVSLLNKIDKKDYKFRLTDEVKML